MFYVYAIRSLHRNYIYKGLTSSLADRLERHNKGYEKTTKPYAPFELIYKKAFINRADARVHEKWLKTGEGRFFLKTLDR